MSLMKPCALYFFQFPALTICPGPQYKPNDWGFVEKYLDMLDPAAPENRERFDFIPRGLAEKRFHLNKQFFG